MTISRHRKQKKRNLRSNAEKAGLLKQWKQSGQTATAFAASHGVARNSLFVWKRVLNDESLVARGGGGFRPVRLQPKISAGEVMVRCPGGFEIKVDAQAGEAALAMAIRAIRQCG